MLCTVSFPYHDNLIGERGILVLHLDDLYSLDVHPEVLQHIASALPASSLASIAAVWLTVAGCFAPCCPHDLLALAQTPGYLSGLALAAGLHVAL